MTAPRVAATLGGPGWQERTASHLDELAAGALWQRCGVSSEVADLRAVALCRPPDSIAQIDDPDAALMLRPVDLGRLRAQARAVGDAYGAVGVRVHWLEHADAPPNLLFLRDTFFMTPCGAIVGRMAARQRAGEERFAAAFLAALGVPIVATITDGTFEGADALWTSPGSVLIGAGKRTDERGAAAVARVLRAQDVEAVIVPFGGPVQHLLGVVNFADQRLAVADARAFSDELAQALATHEVIRLPDSDELRTGRGMNFVTLRPGAVLMPDGCPRIREQLERSGVTTHTVAIDDYLHAAGGLGCITGILERAPARES
jgi:N-dimethylarginine dimethylaminohydrolase